MKKQNSNLCHVWVTKHIFSCIILMFLSFIFFVLVLTFLFEGLPSSYQQLGGTLMIILPIITALYINRNILLRHKFYDEYVEVKYLAMPQKKFVVNYRDIARTELKVESWSEMGDADLHMIFHIKKGYKIPVKNPPWIIRIFLSQKLLKDVPAEYCPVVDTQDIAKLLKNLPGKLKINLNDVDDDVLFYINRYSRD